MDYKDYYNILNVKRNATKSEIKKSYRRLARKYHPDVSKEVNAEAHFKEVNEAYDVLSDRAKRQSYDQLGKDWKNGQNFRPPPSWQGQGVNRSRFEDSHHHSFHPQGNQSGFSDFFEGIFGGGGFNRQSQHQGQQAASKQTAIIQLTLEDIYLGVKKNIRLPNGAGVKVKIPRGIKEGQKIRLKGKGTGGGDIFLKIKLQVHPYFRLDGENIMVNLPITPWESALGGTVEVPTLAGPVKLKIPAGSQSGTKMRLKGRGMQNKQQIGNQYVILQIHTPPADSEMAKTLYKKMQAKLAFNPRKWLSK